MPMIFIEGPPGLSDVAKKKMVADVTRAADEPHHILGRAGRMQSDHPEIVAVARQRAR